MFNILNDWYITCAFHVLFYFFIAWNHVRLCRKHFACFLLIVVFVTICAASCNTEATMLFSRQSTLDDLDGPDSIPKTSERARPRLRKMQSMDMSSSSADSGSVASRCFIHACFFYSQIHQYMCYSFIFTSCQSRYQKCILFACCSKLSNKMSQFPYSFMIHCMM